MIIEEMSNSISVKLEEDEKLIEKLDIVFQKYHIKRGLIRGFGFSKIIEYGTISHLEPLFFNKFYLDKIASINWINGVIENSTLTTNFLGTDIENKMHSGRIYEIVVAKEFEVYIEILLTD